MKGKIMSISNNYPWNKGLKLSDKHKTAISKRMKGKPAWNKGLKLSDEHKATISKGRRGKPAWNKGKPWSQEVKDKISKTKRETSATEAMITKEVNEPIRY